MNLKTFTPEIGKRYGRVLNWTEEQTVTIRSMFEGDEEETDEMDLEELDWNEVQQWKLLH